MRRFLIAAAIVTVCVGAVTTPLGAAQRGTRAIQLPDALSLRGPGASIGVTARDLNNTDKDKQGVHIETVRPDTPAARAGLKSGDVVVEFDGEAVRSVRNFTRLVQETAPGRTVKATIVRDGRRQTLDITPEEGGRFSTRVTPDIGPDVDRAFRNIPFDFGELPFSGERARLGATLMPISDQLLEHFGAANGVLVSTVTPESAGARAGLKAGDVITTVNERRVERPSDVTSALRDAGAGGNIRLRVIRDRKEMTLNATVPERERPRAQVRRYPA